MKPKGTSGFSGKEHIPLSETAMVRNDQICAEPAETTPNLRAVISGVSINDEEAAALARAIVNLFRLWGVGDADARTLLGGMPDDAWRSWQRGQIDEISQEIRTRMALLIGIHKDLRYLFQDPKRGYAWIRKSNDRFSGSSALDIMLRGDLTSLIFIRDHLNAECG